VSAERERERERKRGGEKERVIATKGKFEEE